MSIFGFAFPLLPGKEDVLRKSLHERQARTNELSKSRAHAGIKMERIYLQHNPDAWTDHTGSYFMNVFLELEGSQKDSQSVMKAFKSGSELDRRFLEVNSEVTGLDFLTAEPSVAIKHVASWSDKSKSGKGRSPGLAFTVPILRGNIDARKAFREQAYDKRHQELAESRHAFGAIREEVFVQQTPLFARTDLLTVYVEGPEVQAKANTLRLSKSSFDQWFSNGFKELLPPFIRPVGGAASGSVNIEQEVEFQAVQ